MSLRVKLSWAFIGVAFVALLVSAVGLNFGLHASMLQMHGSAAGIAHEAVMSGQALVGSALRWSLLSSLVAFTVAGLTGYLTAERITRSLRHLRDGAHDLEIRDLSRRVPVEGNDEIAELARDFNRMAERLEGADRSRRQLLADVAHELRHPLAVMQGRLDLILDGKVDLDVAEILPFQDDVSRLTRLVGDLRDLSLAEVGKLTLRKSQLSLKPLLMGLSASLWPAAEEKQISLWVDAPDDLPCIHADPDRIRQVFFNLVTNAMQYTEAGGSVSVRAANVDGAVRVTVTDTGRGIAPEHLPHIFDRFYRADPSRTRATGGTGLGLAIVRTLVEVHEGQISVDSTVGEGTTFTVNLPTRATGVRRM